MLCLFNAPVVLVLCSCCGTPCPFPLHSYHHRQVVIANFVHAALYPPTLHHKYTAVHRSLVLQPPPEDTSTELDPKYKVTYLSASEAAAQPRHQDVQEEAVAASYAFSQLEASLSGVPVSPSNAEAISRLGMTASTSGTTAATEQSKMGCDHSA